MKNALLFFIFIILTSCSSENSGAPTNKAVQGKWKWVQSTGGFAGTTNTPESTNQVIYIEFSGNSFKKYTNGTLTSDLKFVVKTQKSIFGGEKPMLISTDPKSDFAAISFEIKEDKLYLNEECSDCFSSVYVRTK